MQTLNDGARPVNGVKYPSANDVKAALRGREIDALRYLGIDWPQNGKIHIHCPFPGHGDKDASWRWDAGQARFFCTCESGGGDIFDVARIMRGYTLSEAVAELTSAFLGERPDFSCREKSRQAPPPSPDAPSTDDKASRNHEKALTQWNAAGAIEGPAEAYLTGARGITPPPDGWPGSIRYANALYHKAAGGAVSYRPAIIMAMTKAPGGEVEAIGRVWLMEDGSGKADVDPNKAALASIHGLACWFGTPGPRLIVAEGLENGLSALAAGFPFVCVAFTGSNVANITPPPGVKELVFFGDRAKDGEGLDKTGVATLERGSQSWEASGIIVSVVVPNAPHKDTNDVFRAGGPEAVRQVFLDATTNELSLSERGQAADRRELDAAKAENEPETTDLQNAENQAAGRVASAGACARETDEAAKRKADLTAEIQALAVLDTAAFILNRAEHAKRLGRSQADLTKLVNEERRRLKGEAKAADSGGRGATQADILISLARSSAEFFMTADEIAYASIQMDDGRRQVWPVRSPGFKRWLNRRYYEETERASNSDAMNQAQSTFEALADAGKSLQSVHLRRGQHDGKLYLDLCDDKWRAIEITETGWRVVENPPINFVRRRGMLPLPVPERGGSIEDLRRFLNVAGDDDFVMIVSWLLAALRPNGPYPLIALAGAPGVAKSTSGAILRGLVDPNVSMLRGVPKDERDVFISASNSAVLALDNLSSIPAWMSDALCRVATGGGFSTRALHTDDDEKLFNVVRPVIITAVGDVIARADLADRALTVTLTAISDEQRKAESDFLPSFERARPKILGVLLDAVAHGIGELPNVRLKKLPRMAEYVKWTRACEGKLWKPGTIQETFEANLTNAAEAVLESDGVALALLAYLKANADPWEGPVSEAFTRIQPFATPESQRDRSDKGFPRSPAALTNRLRLAQHALKRRGVNIDWRRVEHGRVRLTAIWMEGQQKPKWTPE